MKQIKWFAILLACAMLVGCTAMPTGTIGTDTTASLVAVSSDVTSGENVSSKQAESDKTESDKTILSESLLTKQAVSSKAASNNTQAEATSSVVFSELSRKERAALLKEGYRKERLDVTPELAQIEQDPCILNTNKVFLKDDTKAQYAEKQQKMEKPEKTKYAKMIKDYTYLVAYDEESDTDMPITKSDLEMLDYYGEVDGYKLFYMWWGAEQYVHVYFTRIGGYQFYTTQLGQWSPSFLDKNNNLKKGYKMRDHIYFSGLYMIKDDRVRLMEQLYLDGEIDVETVGKVYDALPTYLQHGKFEHYQEAYNWRAGGYLADYKAKPEFATYYDRDGKFHVVVA